MPKKGVAGLTLSLNELAKPLMLCGTLSDPSVSFDPSKTAVILGKAVGGFVLLGPLGLLGALAGKTSEPNPCAAALKAAKKGVKESDLRRRDERSGRSETGGRSPQGLYSGP
jgi:hypothetical protein